jgi:3,4-dihydroxy 2-butanone 4-phosphate synthase/GTP cyclohydrolase II
MKYMKFDSIENALEVLQSGGLVIVSDDEGRENEGDLICIADLVTLEQINFMITHGRGLVCMPMHSSIVRKLQLPVMVSNHTETFKTAFTVSIDAHPKYGVTTGISAWDRAKTIQVALREEAVPEDLVRPGHIFPLIAKDGGIFERNGHTEAAMDLARILGHQPAGVIVEIIKRDGTMARRDDLFKFKQRFNIPYITIEHLREYMERYGILPQEQMAVLSESLD